MTPCVTGSSLHCCQHSATPGLMGTVLFFNQTHLAEVKGWKLVAVARFLVLCIIRCLQHRWAGWTLIDLEVWLIPSCYYHWTHGTSQPSDKYYRLVSCPQFNGHHNGYVQCTLGCRSACTLWDSTFPSAQYARLQLQFLVFSTAIGPGLTGLLIDWVDFTTQCIGFSSWCFLVAAGSFFVIRDSRKNSIFLLTAPPASCYLPYC